MGISQSTIDRLLRDQKGLCPLCGRYLDDLGMDLHHAVYSRDVHFSKWLDTAENLVALCPKCHRNHGRLTNIEGRKKFWKLKIEQGYKMAEWEQSIPLLIHDRFEEGLNGEKDLD